MNDGRKKIFNEIEISFESSIDSAAKREILNLEEYFDSHWVWSKMNLITFKTWWIEGKSMQKIITIRE